MDDADTSQMEVVERVLAGESLVVEGPPGTGKSQTIENIIAELLAAGKKVLFVSEKLAALDVVKRRLDSVGIGDFCVSMHAKNKLGRASGRKKRAGSRLHFSQSSVS